MGLNITDAAITHETWGVVLKFGGTSVSSKKNWKVVLEQVRKNLIEKNVLIVCSAMSGISNSLEKLSESAVSNCHQPIFEEIKAKHQNFCQELGIDFEKVLVPLFSELENILLGVSLIKEMNPRIHARILSFGELFSTKMGQAFFINNGQNIAWIDARKCLKSIDLGIEQNNESKSYLAAICDCEYDLALVNYLAQFSGPYITQGFIASNQKDECVLLGRGGSDTSAAYFAAKLNATRLEIWTDVPGMFTADPRIVPGARLLKSLDYSEAAEIASSGAKVLHPASIAPAEKHQIPLYIFSTEQSQLEGTIISNKKSDQTPQIKAVATKKNITLISMDTIGMWQQVGFLAKIFDCFSRYGLSIDLISTSETNVTVTLDPLPNALNKQLLDRLVSELSKICKVEVRTGCASIALVGRHLRSILYKLAPVWEAFEEQQIYLLSQSSSNLNLTCVIDADQIERLTQKLHAIIFDDSLPSCTLGKRWSEIFVNKNNKVQNVLPWWEEKRDQLLSMTKECSSPRYIYNLQYVEKMAQNLLSLKSIDQRFYAMKANPNSEILKRLYDLGFNFECVSIEEVEHIFKCFPAIHPKRVLFTPNFAPKEEYQKALDLNIHLTLDNIYPLKEWPQIFKNREILLRIDSQQGHGHHKYVHTAGKNSKFGIPVNDLIELKNLINKHHVKVIGLHAHSGSGIKDVSVWGTTAEFLINIAESFFPTASILDLGGGLGVPERINQSSLKIIDLDDSLSAIKAKYSKYSFWLEPGRYLVAEAGVLLVNVTQIKSKSDLHYIGVNTGMNSLIRPALYGAYHEIVNLTRFKSTKKIVANIVGPICESGDVLGYNRYMPEATRPGDTLLISTVGAYGKAMSSNYTLRSSAVECIF